MRIFSKEKFLSDFDNQEFYFAFILSRYGENKNEIKAMGYSIVERSNDK